MTLKARILVADDDARWRFALEADARARFYHVSNMAEALKLIDGRRRWSGAIFDRYLMTGAGRFASGRVAKDAGFILAAAFLEKFPNQHVSICSGERLYKGARSDWSQLLECKNCAYLFKGEADAVTYAIDFALREGISDPAFSRWLKYIMLEPNFFGLGLNLGRLIADLRRRG